MSWRNSHYSNTRNTKCSRNAEWFPIWVWILIRPSPSRFPWEGYLSWVFFFIVCEKVDLESQTSGKGALEKSKFNWCSPFLCQLVAKLLNKWSRNHDESPIRWKAFFGYFFFLLFSVFVSWKTKYCPDCGSNQPETEMQAREKRRKKKKKIGKYRVIPLNWAKL